MTRPELLVVGRYRGKELELVGRTVQLKTDQAEAIGRLLKPADPRHPWLTAQGASRCRPAETAGA
jgi:hypothetical protein